MKKSVKIIIAIIVVLYILCVIWWFGYFNFVDSKTASDGKKVTVFDADITQQFGRDTNTLTFMIEEKRANLNFWDKFETLIPKSTIETYTLYGGATYENMWWSSDGKMLLISTLDYANEYPESRYLSLMNFETNSDSNLIWYLQMALSNFQPYVEYRGELVASDVAFKFVEWEEKTDNMMFDFSYQDDNNKIVQGSFTYQKATGAITNFEIKTQ